MKIAHYILTLGLAAFCVWMWIDRRSAMIRIEELESSALHTSQTIDLLLREGAKIESYASAARVAEIEGSVKQWDYAAYMVHDLSLRMSSVEKLLHKRE